MSFLDVPNGTRITLPLIYEDRINAEPLDEHHCTIANAIVRCGRRYGILSLDRRGVSRTMVQITLDPKKHKWAVAGQTYRARLTDASAAMTVELDSWYDRPQEHAALKRKLKREAAKLPKGERTLWDQATIVAPMPSQRKGYRKGSTAGTRNGPRPPVTGAPPRRYNGFSIPTTP